MALLKAGDIIVAKPDSRVQRSYWMMERDEDPEDWCRSDKNAHWIGGYVPIGFENDNPRMTSWDHRCVVEQGARVIRADRWPDYICAMVAKWRLTQ